MEVPLPTVLSSRWTPEEARVQTDRPLAQGRCSAVSLSKLSLSLSMLTCTMGRITRGRLCQTEGRRLFASRWSPYPGAHGEESGSALSSPSVESSWSSLAVARMFCSGHANCPARCCVTAALLAWLVHLVVLSFGISLAAFIQLVTEGSRANGGSGPAVPKG